MLRRMPRFDGVAVEMLRRMPRLPRLPADVEAPEMPRSDAVCDGTPRLIIATEETMDRRGWRVSEGGSGDWSRGGAEGRGRECVELANRKIGWEEKRMERKRANRFKEYMRKRVVEKERGWGKRGKEETRRKLRKKKKQK